MRGAVAFPQPPSCARCGCTDVGLPPPARRRTLWTFTTQEFLPKEPLRARVRRPRPLQPYGGGMIELPGEVRVESRLDHRRRVPAAHRHDDGAGDRSLRRRVTTCVRGPSMADVAIIGVGLPPLRPVRRQVGHRHGGRRRRPRAARRRRRAGPTCSSPSAASWEVAHPDPLTGLLGLTGIPFIGRLQRLRHAASAARSRPPTPSGPGQGDIGVAVGMDKHPPARSRSTRRSATVPAVVRRDRPVPHHQVLRHEDQPVHARPRHHRPATAGQGGRPRTTATASLNPNAFRRRPISGGGHPRRRRCSTTR